MTFESSVEAASLRTRLDELLARERELRKFALEAHQMIASSCTETVSSSGDCEHEQSKSRRIEEAFIQCTSVVERELDGLANIRPSYATARSQRFTARGVLRARPRPL